MDLNKEKIEKFFGNKSIEFKQKIRDEAVKRAKQTLRRTNGISTFSSADTLIDKG